MFRAEEIMVGERDLMIGVPRTDNESIYDRVIRVAIVHLVGIEDLPLTTTSKNGPA